MVEVVHEPIEDEQGEMHIWPPADFCGFEHAVPTHPIFEPCLLNANVARWWNGHSSSHLPVLEYTDVDHCALMCLNYLHQTPKVFLNVRSRSSLKRKNHFVAVLSPMALSLYTAQMFLAAYIAFAPLLNLKRRICRE